MTLVVADTGPINYLHLIGRLSILPALFSRVFVPEAVLREMSHPRAPEVVRRLAANPPPWIVVRQPAEVKFLDILDPGEAHALSLALEIGADTVLIDEKDGRTKAVSLGLGISGTLGVLERAAEEGLVRLSEALADLRRTNFRAPEHLFANMLAKDQGRRSRPR